MRSTFPAPTWWSPALDPTSRHLMVGGSTVWVEDGSAPASLVVSHPNAFGGGEDLTAMARLVTRHQAEGWVIVDGLLIDMVEVPPPLRAASTWPEADPGSLLAAGKRALQGALALRQRLRQVPSLQWPVARPAGRTVAVLTPMPGEEVRTRMMEAGVELAIPPPWWKGILTMTVGWWHTKSQLEGVVAALRAVLAGSPPGEVESDQFAEIPDDLPRRDLNRISRHL